MDIDDILLVDSDDDIDLEGMNLEDILNEDDHDRYIKIKRLNSVFEIILLSFYNVLLQ